MTEIVNRIKESGLISISLADYKPEIAIESIDIADILWQRLVLKEKEFRVWVETHNWTQYNNKAVFIHCSEDAIVPTWAFMLIASKLQEHTKNYVIGDQLDLEKELVRTNILSDDIEKYQNGRVIIKGCSDITCPEFAMVELLRFLQPVAKSIMYGEPCSTVPVYKKK
tara:strand:+ start:53092 stop:53595 length:504 start_codon:yes stop_codon:yes gene_type:complete